MRQIGQKSVTIFRTRQGDGVGPRRSGRAAFQDAFLPYENFAIIRTGKFEGTEMAWLARGTTAAITWSSDQAVQVMLDHQAAGAVVSGEKVDTLFSVDEPPAHPKLRIVKVASTPFAETGRHGRFHAPLRQRRQPGDRQRHDPRQPHDAAGVRRAPTAQSSLPASFSAQQNEGGSLVLRWEIAQPLEPGKGGILRFTCRVR